jgi:hypothetical protein
MNQQISKLDERLLNLEYRTLKRRQAADDRAIDSKTAAARGSCDPPCKFWGRMPYFLPGDDWVEARAGNERYEEGALHHQCADCKARSSSKYRT